jgi:MFS transporter, SP family, general alpha glucoside:H+ symporter
MKYPRVPKGRTYGELDVLFEHKVPARKFASTKVDQFAGEHVEVIANDEKDASGHGSDEKVE